MTEKADAGEAGTQGADDTHDWEAEARLMGWVPEEEFKGDKRPARFKTAEEFVRDGETMSPHIKRIMAAQQKEFDERLARVEKLNQHTVEKLEKQYQAELAQLVEQRKQAVADGNAAEVARLSDEIADKKSEKPEGGGDDDAKAEQAFAERNPWYGDDATLTAAAEAFSRQIAKRYYDKHGKQMPYSDNLKQVEEKIKASPEYATRYGSKTAGHAEVDGGGEGAGPRGDPLAKLPAEARAKAKEDMKRYPQIYPTPAAWVAVYNSH